MRLIVDRDEVDRLRKRFMKLDKVRLCHIPEGLHIAMWVDIRRW